MRFFIGLIVGLSIAGALSTAVAAWYFWRQLPAIDALADYQAAEPLRIYSADGELLAQYGPERREVWSLTQIPLPMRQALLAIEDARFYQHGAVDFTGMARAAFANLVQGRQGQGGSTVTMQVARNFYLTREKTWTRKFVEILLAYKLEKRFGKDRLLELYMNEIYLGERAYGFAAAAHIYFGKSLDRLTLAESALLAGLPKAPSAYNPMVNPIRAQTRQRYILERMLALGDIDTAAYRQALQQPITLAARGSSAVREAAYAVEQARLWAVERYGDETYSRGLNLHLTLDMPKQRAADDALREELIAMQNNLGYRGPEGHVTLPHGARRTLEIRQALVAYPDSGALKSAVVTAIGPHAIDVVLSDGELVHIGPEDLEQMLKNADRVDNMTARFFGGLSALGFILGGHATINLTPIMGANLPIDLLPYMPGGITGIADRILSSILTDTHVGYYTKDNPVALEEVMQENLERYQRPLTTELTHQAGALSAPYSIRNVARSVAAPAAAHFGRAALTDLLIDGIGGIPAGAYVQHLRNDGDRQELLMHPAYLLARKNWKSQLEELRHTPFSHQRIMRLINRTCAGSTKIPDILFNACKRLVTIDSATEISLLMLGFACNEWLKETAANEFEDASPEVSAFLKNSVGTFFLGTLYCSLSVAMTGASRLTQILACRQENTNIR